MTVSSQQNLVSPSTSPQYGCPAEASSKGFQVDVTRVLNRGGAQVGTEQFHVTYEPFAGTTCGSNSTQGADGNTGTSSGSGELARLRLVHAVRLGLLQRERRRLDRRRLAHRPDAVRTGLEQQRSARRVVAPADL